MKCIVSERYRFSKLICLYVDYSIVKTSMFKITFSVSNPVDLTSHAELGVQETFQVKGGLGFIVRVWYFLSTHNLVYIQFLSIGIVKG